MLLIYDKYAGDHSYTNDITKNITTDIFNNKLDNFEYFFGKKAIELFNKLFSDTYKIPNNLSDDIFIVHIFIGKIKSIKTVITIIDVNELNILFADINFLAKLCKYHMNYTNNNKNDHCSNSNSIDDLQKWILNKNDTPTNLYCNNSFICFGDIQFDYINEKFVTLNTNFFGGIILNINNNVINILADVISYDNNVLIISPYNYCSIWEKLLKNKLNVIRLNKNYKFINSVNNCIITTVNNLIFIDKHIEWNHIIIINYSKNIIKFHAKKFWFLEEKDDKLKSIFEYITNNNKMNINNDIVFRLNKNIEISNVFLKFSVKERTIYNNVVSNPNISINSDIIQKLCSLPMLFENYNSSNIKSINNIEMNNKYELFVQKKIQSMSLNNVFKSNDELTIENDTCSICLDNIPNHDVGITSCYHFFCYQCLKMLIIDNNKCPCCRENINSDNIFLLVENKYNCKFVDNLLIDKYGTKIISIVDFINKFSNKNIFIYTLWDEFIKLFNEYYKSNGQTKNKVIISNKVVNTIMFHIVIFSNENYDIFHKIKIYDDTRFFKFIIKDSYDGKIKIE